MLLSNQLIHIVFIPTILVTAAGMLNFVPFSIGHKDSLMELNLPLLLILVLMAVYIKIEKVSGVISTIFYMFLTLNIRMYYLDCKENGTLSRFFYQCLFWHMVGWVTQVIGHKIFESNLSLTQKEIQLSKTISC